VTQKPLLTLEDAKSVATAAEAEARHNGWHVTIAVVDDGGHLLYLQRSHDTQFGSVETAIQKAHAAVAFQRPTKASEDAVLNGRLIHLALPGVIPAEGGVPLAGWESAACARFRTGKLRRQASPRWPQLIPFPYQAIISKASRTCQ